MRKTANKDEVIIREGTPTRLPSNKKGVIYEGFSIEVVEIVQGEEIDGNADWYKDLNGDFYWSGDFVEAAQQNDQDADFRFLVNDLNGLSDLHQVDCSTINIAVLDSGLNRQVPDLQFAEHATLGKSYFGDNIDDVYGHGSHVAGIIAGQGPKIIGVASGAKLASFKVITNTGIVGNEAFIQCLNELMTIDEIKVVNMSLSLPAQQPLFDQIDALCGQLNTAGKILIASANEYDDQLAHGAFVPAYSNHVLAVGAFTPNFIEHKTAIHSSFDLLMPATSYYSTYKHPDNYTSLSGSSMNCAFISGLVACMVAQNPAMTLNDIKQRLIGAATSISNLTYFPNNPSLYLP